MSTFIFTSKHGHVGCTTLAANLIGQADHTILDTSSMSTRLAEHTLRENAGQAKIIVPTWSTPMSMQDAAHTVTELVKLYGYPLGDVLVVFNRVNDIDELPAFMADGHRRGLPCCATPVLEFNVYSNLGNRSLESVATDGTDFLAKMREASRAGNDVAMQAAADDEVDRRNARAALRNLQTVREEVLRTFEQLTLQL